MDSKKILKKLFGTTNDYVIFICIQFIIAFIFSLWAILNIFNDFRDGHFIWLIIDLICLSFGLFIIYFAYYSFQRVKDDD